MPLFPVIHLLRFVYFPTSVNVTWCGQEIDRESHMLTVLEPFGSLSVLREIL
jgi:hypothetical protein